MDNCSFCEVRRYHGFVKDGVCFLSFCNDGAGTDYVTLFYCDVCVPFFFCIKGIDTDTSGNIFAGGFCNLFQRALDTVKDVVDDSGSQKYGDGISGTCNCISWFQSCSFLENLHSGHAFFQTDDLTYQMFRTYINHFGNFKSAVALQINDGAVDTVDNTCITHVLVLRQI